MGKSNVIPTLTSRAEAMTPNPPAYSDAREAPFFLSPAQSRAGGWDR